MLKTFTKFLFIPRIPKNIPETNIPLAQIVSTIPKVFESVIDKNIGTANT